MQSAETVRLRGLDTLRFIAITLVLLSHYMGFVTKSPVFGIVGNVGWAGVDLFFVLSGYLIGNQILAPIARDEPLSLKKFFARRLLRTLPNYYVVLALYFFTSLAFPHWPVNGTSLPPIWQMLTFTQNNGLVYGQTFSHSWSLCIEEQFYVFLPLVTLALVRLKCSRALAWLLLGSAIAFGMAARATAFVTHGYSAFSAELYYSSIGRMDELLPGVAIAMLRNFHPQTFARMLRHANAICALGLASAIAILVYMDQQFVETGIATTFGFSLLAMSFALLTCATLAPHCVLNRLVIPGASSLALWSYAIYLTHKAVFMALRPWCEQMGVDTHAPLTIALIMAAAIFSGWSLYRYVESPFMRLRARWYPVYHRPAETVSERIVLTKSIV